MKNKSIITILTFTTFLLMAFVLGSALCLAKQGNGQNNGSGTGNGPANAGEGCDIFSGDFFSYEATITIVFGQGNGVLLDNGEIIYGVGPPWFWESLDLARPDVGDLITVLGYTVACGNEPRNIATEITICSGLTEDCSNVSLRDTDTGLPLWKEAQRRLRHRLLTGGWQ